MIDTNKVVVPADIVARAKRAGHRLEELARLWRKAAASDPPLDFWAIYRDIPETALEWMLPRERDAPTP
jgi:hypothetical protein